jgi:hypothetical protein
MKDDYRAKGVDNSAAVSAADGVVVAEAAAVDRQGAAEVKNTAGAEGRITPTSTPPESSLTARALFSTKARGRPAKPLRERRIGADARTAAAEGATIGL